MGSSQSKSSGTSTEVTYDGLHQISRTETSYRATDGNIAAIDFGTSSLSLAYTTKGDDRVSMIPLDSEKRKPRALNTILLKKSEEKITVEAVGEKARQIYERKRKAEYSEYIYFERIKILMKRDEIITRDTLVESLSGEKYYLVEVIAFILKNLKHLLIEHLSPTVRPLKTTDFDWVITVPAIWDARGKRMMREAAYMAGLLTRCDGIVSFTPISSCSLPLFNEVNPDKLSLALEPESAALYSQKNIASDIDKDPSSSVIDHPKEYMVIDIGGGTVDITAHAEVSDGGGIMVQIVPTGNACGGTQVNEEFSQLLQKLIKDPGYKKFLSSDVSLPIAKQMAVINAILYYDFEGQKCLFGQEEIEGISVVLGKIAQFYDKVLQEEVEKIEGIEYEDDIVYINKEYAESHLFGPVIDGIIDCIKEAITNNEYKADAFYLVGGFGGCKYVHKKLKEVIIKAYDSKGCKCQVLVPLEPHLAVAQGAVLWRKNPEIIRSRLSDATYGIAISTPFDENKHDAHYRYYHKEDEIFRCHSVFFPFLHKNEIAYYNKLMVTSAVPHNQSDTKVRVKIYSTADPHVQYIVDKYGKSTVKEIGQLLLHVPNPEELPKSKRIIDVTMDFSGTEIQAKARYRVNKDEVKTVCDFLSAQHLDNLN